MPGGAFISDRPQLAIARADQSFAILGMHDTNLVRMVYELDTFLSFNPADDLNTLDGITKDKHYLLYLNLPRDFSPDLVNAVLDGLIPQTTTNVFAGVRTVFICTTAVSFAAAGIDATNITDITLVNEGYFISYSPNDADNGIDSFEVGLIYYIDPITDIDLSDYGVTVVQYYDDLVGHVIQEEGVSLPQRQNLNFIGAGVTATDNEADSSTDVTISGGGTSYNFNKSLSESGGNVELDGDEETPGNSEYYGTDGTGIKGFHALPGGSKLLHTSTATENNVGGVLTDFDSWTLPANTLHTDGMAMEIQVHFNLISNANTKTINWSINGSTTSRVVLSNHIDFYWKIVLIRSSSTSASATGFAFRDLTLLGPDLISFPFLDFTAAQTIKFTCNTPASNSAIFKLSIYNIWTF